MAESMSNNREIESTRSRKKRRKINVQNSAQGSVATPIDHTRWRNATEQQIYSSKLVEALRHGRGGGGVRDTADRVLAVAAKGRTRWSRAILTSRLSMRLNQINRKHKRGGGDRKRKVPQLKRKVQTSKRKVQPLQQKVRVLGRLVPGCRKVSLPSLLEETTDYIAALEMQVRAMTFLDQLLSGAAALAPPPAQP